MRMIQLGGSLLSLFTSCDLAVLMIPNPYASPKSDSTDLHASSPSRRLAQRCLRLALLILLAPATYNFICFSYFIARGPDELRIQNGHAWITWANGFGFCLTAVAIWSLGLPLLELLTVVIHRIFGRAASVDAWKEALYQALSRAPLFSVLGAVLWTLWVAAIYQLGVGFYAVSVPIGVAAHLLAAGLYVPLFLRWYTLEHSKA